MATLPIEDILYVYSIAPFQQYVHLVSVAFRLIILIAVVDILYLLSLAQSLEELKLLSYLSRHSNLVLLWLFSGWSIMCIEIFAGSCHIA